MPDDADATADAPDSPSGKRRPWRIWLRWGAIVVVIVVLGVEGYYVWPKLKETWEHIGELRWEWVLACIVAAGLSMDSYAQVQRALMRSAGVKVSQTESLAVILASNSVSQTMPGGQVLAPAFVYRESRKWGATPVIASWQVVMSGLLAGAGLAVLGLGGALLAGAKTSPFSVIFSIAGFLVFAIAVQYLASHPQMLENAGLRVLGWVNNIRDKAADHGTVRLKQIIEQLEAVQLNRRDGAIAFGWSFFNWVADVACLAFACYAVEAHPSFAGLMVAYAAGKAVGTAIPLLPGGIGVVDITIQLALTSAGMPAGLALTAVLIYRVVSYILVAVVGWVVIAVRYRGAFKSDVTLDKEMADDRARIARKDDDRSTSTDATDTDDDCDDGRSPA
ncbi:YbhN family protein [Gordonia sp. HY442]|uniref:lysylphosphatidylglycerol synthase transmembrane domain-containing protein n=1 Tax=Gordonia zhenghanii TaxID=2911516 RepID=UPI001F19A1AD|nr:lysylphosphatidylglycerol synthase transmembrane domain-containing protein [Gordonia zhenghanii]MCF8605283.1 YbhN family protein [Gordonia zhenghanii]